jgi:DNA topoisomerase-2
MPAIKAMTQTLTAKKALYVLLRSAQSKRFSSQVEATYQRLTPREHVLRRPEVYLGPVELVDRRLWTFPRSFESLSSLTDDSRLVVRNIRYSPALYKIFDEILVNAIDNARRDAQTDAIDIWLPLSRTTSASNASIRVRNTGRGIPIMIHPREQIYVPELLFGHLLTGSNFDDTQTSIRLTGGRHGYGAKLTNIMSRRFQVETVDHQRRLRYRQEWRLNMSECAAPEITPISVDEALEPYTEIVFEPDLERFGLTHFDRDTLLLMTRRAFDVAGILANVEVRLNGVVVPWAGFDAYVQRHGLKPHPSIVLRLNDLWEVGVRALYSDEQGAPMVSFVNGVATFQGGSHVQCIADLLSRRIAERLSSRYKTLADVLTPSLVRSQTLLFVNCLVNRPAFESQSKEMLTSRQRELLSSLPDIFPTEKQLQNVLEQTELLQRLLAAAEERQAAQVRGGRPVSALVASASRGTGALRRLAIPKLEDANAAGGPESHRCTLILTEGDSAKALAMAGLGVVGRDYHGVFPLRGKLLNVRDCHPRQLAQNEEVNHLRIILGLEYDRDYATTEARKSLRYGRVMLMTDQDHDGSHIRGLIVNLFDFFWPSLLQHGDFLEAFVSPIVKATPRQNGGSVQSFFTIAEFKQWWERLPPTQRQQQWRIKYYKGLGTSTSEEGKAYFRDLDRHRIRFAAVAPEDRQRLDLAFNKSRAEERKGWLAQLDAVESTATTAGAVEAAASTAALPLATFVDRELALYSHANNIRSIPSAIDGLKPAQRKVLYACLKRDLQRDIKVAQLAGYVAEQTAYHHGEESLHSTIIHMAQDFCGANNIPLLQPLGQFGTRLQGGKDAASARYIYTCLSPVTRKIFSARDDPILSYGEDDGQEIEPEYFVPIIPMALVNGIDGVGTGWSTSVPPFHPLEIMENIRRLLEGQSPKPLKPWYRRFRGELIAHGELVFLSRGLVERLSGTTFRIRELPVGRWTESYKEFLHSLAETGVLKGFREYHTDEQVCFELVLTRVNAQRLMQRSSGLFRQLRLESTISCTNMHLFSAEGRIRKYDTPMAILEDFMVVREQFYHKRLARECTELERKYARARKRVQFLDLVVNGKLVLFGRPLHQVRSDMVALGIPVDEVSGSLEELLSIPIRSLTREEAQKAQQEAEHWRRRWQETQATTVSSVWHAELEQLEESLRKMFHEDTTTTPHKDE